MKVDGLEVYIQASASKACTELDKLSNKLTTIQGKLGGSALSSKNGIFGLSSALNGLPKMKTGIFGLSNGLNSLSKSSKSASTEAKSLAYHFGKFYANCFLLIRGVKALGRSVVKSMDYIETYNYFNVINDKISKEFGSQFEKYVYESAEAYTESFQKRLNELTGKMTGFNIGSEGGLYMTNSAGLGMDPEKIMNYEASITSITNSLGLCGETSINTAKALTMLAADMSSLKNQKLDTVMTNFQSGIIGQSRALYKYGIDITNATLQTYAYKYGIKSAISSMTQADKMQLRLLAILDQSKVAWGDMANTINGVANQYRIMQQQISNLARVLGSLLLPIVQKVLPYINGLIIALQRLFTWIGSLIGVKWSGLMDGISAGAGGIGDIGDYADDAADSLDDANGAAKKLKNTVLGFDQLNQLNDNTSSGSGGGAGGGAGLDLSDEIGNAVLEYQKAWDEAFKNMEDKASEIADMIENFFAPLKKSWNKYGDYVMKSWKYALDEIGKLILDIGRDFNDVWNQTETIKIFDNILITIGNIGRSIGNIAKNIREAWNYLDLGKRILENIRDIILIFAEGIKNASDATVEWSKKLDFKPLFKSINSYLESLKPLAKAVSDILEGFYIKVLLPLAKWTLEKGLPSLFNTLRDFNKKINWNKLKKGFDDFWDALEPFAETVGEGLILFLGQVLDIGAAIINSGIVQGCLKGIEDWMKHVTASQLVHGLELLAVAIGLFRIEIFKFQAGITIAKGLGDLYKILSAFGVEASTITAGLTSIAGGIGSIVATSLGVTGIAVAIFSLADAYRKLVRDEDEKMLKSYADFQDRIGSNVDKLNGTADALKEISQYSDEVVEGADAKCEQIDAIAKKYFELAEGSHEGAVKQSELRDSALDLIREVPELGGLIDSNTGAYKAQKDEIQAVIDKQKEYLQVVAYKNIVGDYADALADANVQLRISENKYEKVKGGVKDLNDALNSLTDDEGQTYDQWKSKYSTVLDEYGIKVSDSADAVDQLSEQILNYEKELEGQTTAQSNAEQAVEDATEKYKIATEELENHSTAYEDLNNQVDQIIQENNFGKLALDASNAIDDLGGVFVNGRQVVGQDAVDLYNEVKSKFDTMNQDFYDLGNDGVVQFGLGGKDGASEAVPTMTDELEQQIIDWYNNSGYDVSVEAGKVIVNGTAEGFNEYTPTLTAEMASKFASNLDNELYKSSLGIQDSGKQTFSGYAAYSLKGLQEEFDRRLPSIKGGFETFLKNATSGVPKSTNNFGKDTVDGYNDGIKKNSSSSNYPIFKWMDGVNTSIHNSSMSFGSPSKTAYDYGLWTIQGFNNGITNNIQSTITAITSWTESIKTTMQTGLGMGLGNNNMFSGLVSGFNSQFELFKSSWSSKFGTWKTENNTLYFGKEVWSAQLKNPMLAYDETWKSFSDKWKTNMDSWWKTSVAPFFEKTKWNTFGSSMKDGMYEGFKGIVSKVTDICNKILDSVEKSVNKSIDAMNKAVSSANKTSGVNVSKVSNVSVGRISVPAYANGGMPNTGQLFMARENGINEMVGRIGNKSAVVNNDQIVDSIKNAVFEAMIESSMISSSNSNGGNAPYVEVTIKADSETLYKTVQKGKEISDKRYNLIAQF